jgi:Ca-activated chloride channel family protein
VVQGFRNPFPTPLEATYVFPLPPRAALTRLTLTADDRVIEAQLQERGAAREAYDQAIAAGQRAAIAEEERPDVFTLRVGNILPGEQVTVALRLAQPLALVDGEAEFRFPLVVAPRYIPGRPLDGEQAGDGYAPDTDAVPDASRITPPVLLPGFPNPVALSLRAEIDAAGLELTGVKSSLHAVSEQDGVVEIRPGERLNRDFILRLAYAGGSDTLVFAADPAKEGQESTGGTFQLIAFPPDEPQQPRPRDVVLLLDRSGSMEGWKMVAARRAAARIIDTLVDQDRFAALTFDTVVERPDGLPTGLAPATDRNRYRAVEHLSRTDSRGGTELLAPLREGLGLLTDAGRDRVLVLVTDGQVGNEDQILRETHAAATGVRVHTVGIDQAVNAGFLGRLAAAGRGRCELVESEDRLDAAMDRIHRRIGSPAVLDIAVDAGGVQVVPGTVTGVGDLFPGVPLVVAGRYAGEPGALALAGTTVDGRAWRVTPEVVRVGDGALAPLWARAYLRTLEDRYAVSPEPKLAEKIVATSLRHGVLCRFTAYVAVDTRVVTDGAEPHRVVQPVEQPAGWAERERSAVPMMLAGMAYPLPASSPYMPAPSAPMAAPPPGAMPRMTASAGGFARPARARAFGEAAKPAPPAQATAEVLGLLTTERAALLGAVDAPEYQRRDLLDDIASRLDALSRDPAAGPHAVRLRELVAALRDTSVPLAKRWELALDALAGILGGGDAGGGATRRRAFWR